MHALPSTKLSSLSWVAFTSAAILATSCNQNDSNAKEVARNRAALEAMAQSITHELLETEKITQELATQITALYPDLDERARSADRSQYELRPNGVLHRPGAVKNNLPAVFVSGVVPVTESVWNVVLGTEAIDPLLTRAVGTAVVQAYYNDKHSYNRIYPPFDVLPQYPPGMDIPAYNFYYLADEKHNPEKRAVWVNEPYVDPAGRGWMISCIAPVYHQGQLVGVPGLDITVESIIRTFDFENRNRFCILVSPAGTVVATGEPLMRILRLPDLKSHRYVDTVRSDTFRSSDYNMLHSRSQAVRTMATQLLINNLPSSTLDSDPDSWKVIATPIPNLNWKLMEFHRNP